METDDRTDPQTPLLPTPTELLDLLPFGVLVHDVSGRIVQVNRPFADLLGYPSAELLKLNAASVIHPDEPGHNDLSTTGSLCGNADLLMTKYRLVHRDGHIVLVRARHSRVADDDSPQLVLLCVQEWAAEHEQIAELTWAAYHDGLTGLVNRAGLIRHLAQLQQEGREAAVALIDLNGFKAVNDSYGHSGGDDCLRAVAKRLTAAVTEKTGDAPNSCLVARLAGDEFVVVRTEPADPVALDQLIRQSLVEPIGIRDSQSDNRIWLTVSAAVGSVARQQWMDPEQVLDWADRQMYADKAATRSGRAAPSTADPATFAIPTQRTEPTVRQRIRRWHEHSRSELPDS